MADNRTKITRAAIKDGMLDLMAKTPFQFITVAALCREAGVGRATFYTHYTGLMDVIDELADDAIQAAERTGTGSYQAVSALAGTMRESEDARELEKHMNMLPLCQRVADHPRYHVLFRDDFVSEYIIMRVFRSERPEAVAFLMGQCGLTEEVAEKMFLFCVMGAHAVNRSLGWEKNDVWYEVQKALLTYLDGGNEALMQQNRKRKNK